MKKPLLGALVAVAVLASMTIALRGVRGFLRESRLVKEEPPAMSWHSDGEEVDWGAEPKPSGYFSFYPGRARGGAYQYPLLGVGVGLMVLTGLVLFGVVRRKQKEHRPLDARDFGSLSD